MMSQDKYEQNIERVYNFLFHTLGCDIFDAKIIIGGVRRRIMQEGKFKKLVCDKCGKLFDTQEEAGEHATDEKHYSFNLEGTKYRVSIG